MKRICTMLALILLLAAAPRSAGAESIDGALRVYLKSMGQVDGFTVTLQGSYSVNGEADMRFMSGAEIDVTAYEGRLYLTCGGMTVNLGSSFTLARHGNVGGVYLSGSQRGLMYMGDLELSLRDGHILPILEIDLEDYLMGVVPYEMSDSFPLEALKAQAVAARTYAVRMRESRDARGYDLVDTPADQVFMGYDPSNANGILACQETAGMVGLYKGKYATCFYTASNGGQTALPSDIWEGGGDYGYLSRRDDPYDLANKRSVVKAAAVFSDGVGLPDKILSQLVSCAAEPLAAMGYGEDAEDMRLDRIVNIEAVEPNPEDSRLFTKLRFTYTMQARPYLEAEADESGPAPAPGEAAPTPAAEAELGDMEPVVALFTADVDIFDDIKTGLDLKINGGAYELFTVVVNRNDEGDADSFVIQARRYGHGVGMSQRGAQEMAGVYGMSYEDILSFYYPGMELTRYDVAKRIREPLPPLFGQENELPPLRSGEQYGTVRVAGVAAALNVRSQPTTQSEVIGQAFEGDTIIVVKEAASGWYQVRTGQLSGYAAAEYIELD